MAAAMAVSLTGCGSITSGKRIIRISHAQSETHPEHLGLLAFKEYVEERLGDKNAFHTYLQIAHTCNEEAAEELKETVRELYPSAPVFVAPLSLSIGCHIGPGALAVACTGMLKELD